MGHLRTPVILASLTLALTSLNAARAATDEPAAAGTAAPAPSAPDAPRTRSSVVGQIKFASQAVDFGETLRGQKLKQSFTFTNTGKGPLVIQGVHAACGCVATEVSKGHEYAPGQSGAIDVTLDTSNFSGNLIKTVTVMTNERQLSDRTLTLRAMVREEIIVDPPVIDFGEVMSSEGGRQTAIVRAARGKTVAVNSLKFNDALLNVTSDKSDREWLLTIQLKPDLNPGFIKETIVIKNTSTAMPDLPLLVRANIRGNIIASPKYVEFGAIPRESKIQRAITLNGSGEFEIKGYTSELTVNGTRVADSSGLIRVDFAAESTTRKDVTVEITNDGKNFGAAHGRVTIETSDAKTKTLSVDFYAFFK